MFQATEALAALKAANPLQAGQRGERVVGKIVEVFCFIQLSFEIQLR